VVAWQQTRAPSACPLPLLPSRSEFLPKPASAITLCRMSGTPGRWRSSTAGSPAGLPAWRRDLSPYLGAVAITAAALVLALLIKTYLFVANIELVFLGGVVLCAVRGGLRPALLACLLSALSLNFFFFPPLHDLRVKDPEDAVAAVIFVAVAVFVGRLTARARAVASLADNRAKMTEELYGFARRLTSIDDLDELLRVTAEQIAVSVGVETVLLLLQQQVLVVRATAPTACDLESDELVRAEEILAGNRGAPIKDKTAAAPKYLFLPMRSAGGTVGVVGISRDGRPPALSVEERGFVEAIADQAAVAVSRLTLNADLERARVAAETESLRSAMLSAISHDLRTPLASILGAATSLGTYNAYFEQQGRDELVATIREEAERMSRFIGNLLDITRVESGTLEVRNDATDVGEVVGAAVRRARHILGEHQLQLRVAPDLPLLDLDGVILEQTLFNLLDNAGKYSPSRSTIAVETRRLGSQIVIKVMDEGPGIPPQDLQRIFEKFYRSAHSGRQRAGTGLGLAICCGFVEAMGGRIIAGNRADRPGAVFQIGFPLPAKEAVQHLADADDD
jgi:two-component system sensor histidine kinase KdpD